MILCYENTEHVQRRIPYSDLQKNTATAHAHECFTSTFVKKKKKKPSEFNLESFFCKRQLLLAFSQAILTAVLVLNASSFLKK